MVYFLTSVNVKLLRRLSAEMEESEAGASASAAEFVQGYVERCGGKVQEEKLAWVADSLLALKRHRAFLRRLCAELHTGLSDEDADHLQILLFAVLFQLAPEAREHLYRCVFNLSKPLLRRFSTVFSNNEVLPYVSQLARQHYDAEFVANNIISPLFLWQPYIGEMAHDFESYLQRAYVRRVKSPTVPSHINVLSRVSRPHRAPATASATASAPGDAFVEPRPPSPNPLCIATKHTAKKNRMLTKSAIDMRLKAMSQQNKQKAARLLNVVKTQEFNYTKNKSNKFHETIANIEQEIKISRRPPSAPKKFVQKKPTTIINETITSIKRMSKTVANSEKDEVKLMEKIVRGFSDTAKIEDIEENERAEREIQRKVNIERNRLVGQLSYEEAIIAKRKVFDEKKNKYELFLKEKKVWLENIEVWKIAEVQKNKQIVDKMSFVELEVLEAKRGLKMKKESVARSARERMRRLLASALRERNEDVERRATLMREMKVLALVAREARLPRVVDLTQTSGLGLLCEMSAAELSERLAAAKMLFKEQLEKKKKDIKACRENAKQELKETKTVIEKFLAERSSARTRKGRKVAPDTGSGDVAVKANKEITQLKEKLEAKRRERQRTTAMNKY